jgi:Phosphorylase superfamily
VPPLLDNKNPAAKSVFAPAALLREARRQKGLAATNVPSICVLDPDGDIVRRLKANGDARIANDWPCYHTELYTFTLGGKPVGIIGCAVGAPFAVLIAEELFASGCRILISITSAGQITPAGKLPYFVVIDRALRDEGTSYHYAKPSEYSEAEPQFVSAAMQAIRAKGVNVALALCAGFGPVAQPSPGNCEEALCWIICLQRSSSSFWRSGLTAAACGPCLRAAHSRSAARPCAP